jgi:glycosyltransferase involved in cell wall biosynthesis
MKVIISGLPLFSQRLAQDLQEFDSQSKYTFLNTYNSKIDQLKFLFLVPFADLVISMNGVSDNSGSLNWTLFWKKKLVLQWMGTDALLAMQRKKDNVILRKYIDYGENFVDSPWLEAEVKSLEVNAKRVPFKHVSPVELIDKYDDISVITYIAESKAHFYGFERVQNIAKKFPDMIFHIYGMEQPENEVMPNMKFYGWTPEEEFKTGLKNSAIFVRLTEHDGFSVSILEALVRGCEVIWTHPCENVMYVTNDQELESSLIQAKNDIVQRGFTPNKRQSLETIDVFRKKRLLENYISQLKGCLEKK